MDINTCIQLPDISIDISKFSGGRIGKVTPVPIPNTEVKLTGADDTAPFRCGKAGSRRDHFEEKARSNLSGLFPFCAAAVEKGWN